MHRHRFDILLGTLVLFLLAMPVLSLLGQGLPAANFVAAAFLVAMLLSAVFAVSQSRRTAITALALAVPAIVLRLLNLWFDQDGIMVGEHVIEILFIGYVIFVLLKHLFSTDRVSFNTICASLCTYLLLGVLWAMVYSTLDIAQPESFAFPLTTEDATGMMRFSDEKSVFPIYFSFVTMTTLGYGDIVPTSPIARMLAAMEALMGQLYLTVLVARLVGMHISQTRAEKT
jgi:voltage-gated potassium channel